MPFDSNGVYTPPSSSFNPAIVDTDINADDWNALLIDISNALSKQPVAEKSQSFAASASPWTLTDPVAITASKVFVDGVYYRMNNFTLTNGDKTVTPNFSLVGKNLVDIFYV